MIDIDWFPKGHVGKRRRRYHLGVAGPDPSSNGTDEARLRNPAQQRVIDLLGRAPSAPPSCRTAWGGAARRCPRGGAPARWARAPRRDPWPGHASTRRQPSTPARAPAHSPARRSTTRSGWTPSHRPGGCRLLQGSRSSFSGQVQDSPLLVPLRFVCGRNSALDVIGGAGGHRPRDELVSQDRRASWRGDRDPPTTGQAYELARPGGRARHRVHRVLPRGSRPRAGRVLEARMRVELLERQDRPVGQDCGPVPRPARRQGDHRPQDRLSPAKQQQEDPRFYALLETAEHRRGATEARQLLPPRGVDLQELEDVNEGVLRANSPGWRSTASIGSSTSVAALRA